MAFSDKLVAARKAKKLSQESLSKISGVSQSAISFIEKGMRSPTEETMKLLADALGVAVTDLMDEQAKTKKDAQVDEFAEMFQQMDAMDRESIMNLMKSIQKNRK